MIGVDSRVAKHLSLTYGDMAADVIKLCSDTGKRWPQKGTLLVEGYPYLEGEVRYAVREYARTAVDVLARRTRLAFLNKNAARDALPMVIDIMRRELGWDEARCVAEKQAAKEFFTTIAGPVPFEEEAFIRKQFNKVDIAKDGSIDMAELKKLATALGEDMTDEELATAYKEMDSRKTGRVSVLSTSLQH
jgi:glycerol-3-phosphate dehydrogenase